MLQHTIYLAFLERDFQVIFMFFALGEGHLLKPPQIFGISMERMKHLVHSTQLLMTVSTPKLIKLVYNHV